MGKNPYDQRIWLVVCSVAHGQQNIRPDVNAGIYFYRTSSRKKGGGRRGNHRFPYLGIHMMQHHNDQQYHDSDRTTNNERPIVHERTMQEPQDFR
jgi:hypothetical protein